MERNRPDGETSQRERPHRRKLNWLVLAIFICALLIAGFVTYGIHRPYDLFNPYSRGSGLGAGPNGIAVDCICAPRRIYETVFTRTAVIVQNPDIPVTSGFIGWLKAVNAGKGDRVNAGDPICTLQLMDDSSAGGARAYEYARQAFSETNSQLTSARNLLSQRESGLYSSESGFAQARLALLAANNAQKLAAERRASAEQSAEEQRAELARMQDLFEQGAASRQELEQAEQAYSSTASQLAQSESALSAAQSETCAAAHQVESAEESVSRAMLEVRQMRASVDSARKRANAQRDYLLNVMNQLRLLSRGERLMVLRAPVGGEISSIMPMPGVMMTPEMEVARVKPKGVSAVAFDAEDDEVSKIRVGMPVAVRVPQSDVELFGRVRAVPPTAFGGSKRHRVFIEVRDPRELLPLGRFTDARVILQKKRVVAIPTSALTQTKYGTFAWIAVNGQAMRRRVAVAGRKKETAMISNGILPGERVIIYAWGTLSNGCPVAARNL